jgi:hypothetical protein
MVSPGSTLQRAKKLTLAAWLALPLAAACREAPAAPPAPPPQAAQECSQQTDYLLHPESPELEAGVSIENCGGRWQIALSRIVTPGPGGKSVWKLLQRMVLDDVRPGERIYGSLCAVHGVADSELIGIGAVTPSDCPEMVKPRRVLRASVRRGGIVAEANDTVVCRTSCGD